MNQLKQNIMVVSILFLSLLTSVALSYAITPTDSPKAADQPISKTIKAEGNALKTNKSLVILLPRLVK